MNIILFTKCVGRPLTFRLGQPRCYITLLAGFVLLGSSLMSLGYYLGTSASEGPAVDQQLIQAWETTLHHQKKEMQDVKDDATAHINALSLRLGQLQAHVIRLDALGDRLTRMAKLDKGEFDFDQPPAQGGPDSTLSNQARELPEFLASMDSLSRQLEDREHQLSVLETMMLHSNLEKQVLPTGRPVTSGWISSYFGKRTDPFTGKKAYHEGMDFAGKLGSDVVAVGAGVVTWSGDRYGYGSMVEIDHGNGYVTRYAHNKQNMVKVGDTVKKGQLIAKMGSSGRSTGPHVHFEVLRNGRVVNPTRYIQASAN
jgi:murein DD-endopeptidase MepM/ murein hydrolase activator NlpD